MRFSSGTFRLPAFRTIMLRVFAVLGACLLGAVLSLPASAHDAKPVKLIPLEPEAAYDFTYNGSTYTVWNTQRVNFLGLYRIEVRAADDTRALVWWLRQGPCFTAEAFEAEACMTQERYLQYFTTKLANASSASGYTGSGTRKDLADRLADYPCLKKRLSTNQAATADLTPPDC